MTKAVFTTKASPTYDDLPEQRYHFPRSYLRQVEATVGDWIVYYEPRRPTGDLSSRGGRQAYFAAARVVSIETDLKRPDHFYARIDEYLDFDRPVPFRDGGHYYETALRRNDGGTSKGAFGRAVRNMSDEEYDGILRSGFVHVLDDQSRAGSSILPQARGLADEAMTFERPVVERLIARPFRDAAFSGFVKSAYDDTCVMTGLKIINGGGRSEVQAAHIRPVAASGPDSIRNGLALCGTMHWMFDRGLISVDDDYRLLLAPEKVPEAVQRMLNPNRQLRRPLGLDQLPHPSFLKWHREFVFKG